MSSKTTVRLGTFAVLAHLVVNVLHGSAHTRLQIALTNIQTWFVLIVILIMPLIAGALLWTRYLGFGFVLLTVSMAASLIFGVYFHYVYESADHVSHLPPGDAQGLFRITALLLAVTETFGVVIGLLGLKPPHTGT
jgi:hypothetical protein